MKIVRQSRENKLNLAAGGSVASAAAATAATAAAAALEHYGAV